MEIDSEDDCQIVYDSKNSAVIDKDKNSENLKRQTGSRLFQNINLMRTITRVETITWRRPTEDEINLFLRIIREKVTKEQKENEATWQY